MSHFMLIAFSGAVWLGIGTFLMFVGLNLLTTAVVGAEGAPLLGLLASLIGGRESAAIILVVAGLFIGRFKAKKVLSRVVTKGVARIVALPMPVSIQQVYGIRYLFLIFFMMGLGVLMRLTAVPGDIRGLVDLAVGSALISGGVHYLRCAFSVRRGDYL